MGQPFLDLRKMLVAAGLLILALLACARLATTEAEPFSVSQGGATQLAGEAAAGSTPGLQPPQRNPGDPLFTPTPDAPHALPTLRAEPFEYTVQAGDTMNKIAQAYGVGVNAIVAANDLASADYLEVGQILTIPAPDAQSAGSSFKIIPDSELVNGPYAAGFDTLSFVKNQGGYLASYREELEGAQVRGADVVNRVALEYSVNPRLLLAILEYQSGWVIQAQPDEDTLDYPLGVYVEYRKGLYRQLSWAANSLNRGYYLWRVNALAAWSLLDGDVLPISPQINAGTAAVQHLFSELKDRPTWEQAVSEAGLYSVYNQLFGYPFDYAIEPLLPAELSQPTMQLPFEDGQTWAYTGGPHGGWGGGSAWAALDFAPPGEALGCVQSEAWVAAVADGIILRAENGAVVQDLDQGDGRPADGVEQTGWTVLYMHIESRERIQAGTVVKAGDRIGHPSCEGGVSTGTHLHLARRYNGEWIPADQSLPFVLDGWVSAGAGREYDGYLKREGKIVEAWEGRVPANAIDR